MNRVKVNVSSSIAAALRRRLATNDRTIEAELWDILQDPLQGPPESSSLKDLLMSMPNVGADEDFARIRQRPRRSN